MGGKRQANVLSALIQNFDTAESAIEASASSTGSALHENEIFLDSFEGRLQQLTNVVQTKWSEALDTDVIKDAIQLFTKLVDTLDFGDSALVDTVGLLIKGLNGLLDLVGDNNFGYTLIAFFSAKQIDKYGWPKFFDKFKKQGEETVESLEKNISQLENRKANRQKGLSKKGFTEEQIKVDPKIKQWNKEIDESREKITKYNEKVKETDDTLKDVNATTTQAATTTSTQSGTIAANSAATSANSGQQAANGGAQASNTGARASNDAVIDEQNRDIATQNGLLEQNNVEQIKNGVVNKKSATSSGGGLKSFLKGFATMIMIQSALQAIDGALNLIKGDSEDAAETFEELHDEFERESDNLQQEKSELNDIESELDDINDQILEIQSLGELSFAKEEELKNLQKEREELERMAEIQGIIAQNQQKKTNNAALAAAKAYMQESAETDEARDEYIQKETEKVTKWTDTIGDGVTAVGTGLLAFGPGPITKGVGALLTLGGFLTKIGGKHVAENNAEKKYDKQQTNQQAIDSYAAKIANYEKRLNDAYAKGNAEEYDKIKEEYEKFEVMMSDNIGGLISYLNSVDYKTLSDTKKKEYEAFQKIVNQYSLANDGSLVNVINSILSYDRYEKTGYDMKQVQKQLKKGEVTEEDATAKIKSLITPELLAELTALNPEIKIDNIVNSYVQQGVEAMNNASLMDSLDKISAVTNAFDDLGDAVKEFREEGRASVGTLESLNETFGSIDGFEELYKVLATGEGDLETAVTNVANAYVGQVGVLSDMTDEEINIMISRLKTLGVLNAEEVLMARQKGQAQLDALGLAYSIDLSNYGTAEQAKLAIAQAAGLNIANIADNQVETLAKQYGIDLENYATTEEAKIAIAQARAKAEASTNRADLKKKYNSGDISYAEYQDGLTDIDNSLNFSSAYSTIQGIINNAYQGFKFDFNNQPGIGSDFDGGDDDDDGIGDSKEDTVKEGWEKLISEYENKLALITNERDLIQAEIDRIEAQGGQASKEMYDDLIRSQLEEKKLLEEKKKALEDYLAEHGDSIDPETWTEYNNAINETAVAIKECETNIIDFAKALHDIDMHYFNQAIDEISRLGEEIEFVMSLFEDEEMFDEDGNWTDAGITKINLLKDLITTYAATANMWKDRMTDLDSMEVGENGLYKFDEDTKNRIAADFKSMLDSGQIDQATYDEYMKQLEEAWAKGGFSKEVWTEWKNEAEDGWRGAVSAGKDAQDQLIEMNDERIDAIEEGIQKEIEAYEDYIDVLKESLDAERDLYDFKKNVKKQSKDIASIERRIAALSGSTNASDIAERRKLEAELLEAKEGLNDTYYEHSRDQQSQALDDEAEAFSKAKEKYVEYWREYSKDTNAVLNDMFLNGIFNADVANEFLLGIQEKYGIPLSTELTTPWATAAETATGLKEKVGVPVDNTVTMISDSIIKKLGTDDENNPWNKAVNMASKYANFLTSSEFSIDNNDMTTFEGQINSIVKGWNDVKKAADDAYVAQTRQATVGGVNTGSSGSGGSGNNGSSSSGGSTYSKQVEDLQKIMNFFFGANISEDGKFGPGTRAAVKNMQKKLGISSNGVYNQQTYEALMKYLNKMNVGSWFRSTGVSIPGAMPQYAKGTLGTLSDELAIVDELGPELIMHADPTTGRLQYLTKGSSVVPSDLSANLVEWGKLNPDMLKVGGGANINMISNAVTKPELNFSFDSLVHVDNCSQDTLKDLEKMVDGKINQFSKQLNYAIKKYK